MVSGIEAILKGSPPIEVETVIVQSYPILEKLSERSGEYVSRRTLYRASKPVSDSLLEKRLNTLEDAQLIQREPNSFDNYKILRRGKKAFGVLKSLEKVSETDWRIRHKRIGEKIGQYNREQEILKIASSCIC